MIRSSAKISFRKRIRLIGEICRLFGKAIQIREFRRLDLLTLPPVRGQAKLTDAGIYKMCYRINRLANIMCFWRWGKCFYRSFITASILRQFGVPLMLNIGVEDPFSSNRGRGHCWITLNGKLLHEPFSTQDKYTVYLGQHEDQIIYWTSQQDSQPVTKALTQL